MPPAIGGMHQLGGSHAQQDVLEQVFLVAALKAKHTIPCRPSVVSAIGQPHKPCGIDSRRRRTQWCQRVDSSHLCLYQLRLITWHYRFGPFAFGVQGCSTSACRHRCSRADAVSILFSFIAAAHSR
jgi:hypothetical protein